MKISNVSKLIGAGVLAASVAVVPFTLPASAQTGTGTGTGSDTTTTTTAPSATVDNTADNNDTDWGWLGLLGLTGLAGLLGRKRPAEVHSRNADEIGSPTYRP
jgi:LPXTG-motif cell wall-anchored protein